jgi:hypothetical protein
MTLELSKLTHRVREMGEDLAARQRKRADLVALARGWLSEYAGREDDLRHTAVAARAAVPTSERLDSVHPLPPAPEKRTVIGADGSQIQPDRHGQAYYFVINVGSLVYRHGSGEAPEPASAPLLAFTEGDLYEDGFPVEGNALDLRRDLAEVTQLADLCHLESERARDAAGRQHVIALVDGTLVLWVLEDRFQPRQRAKVAAYLDQLDRIRNAGAAVAAFTSRPLRSEVNHLLHLADSGGDPKRAAQEPNPLERLPDRILFGALPPGARSALFVSHSPINQAEYARRGHTVHFCYVNVAKEGCEPVVARVELPAWVAEDADLLRLTHASVVAQARITGDYPYVLARADELAFISGPERQALDDMVATALLSARILPASSPKATYKEFTRQAWRRRR